MADACLLVWTFDDASLQFSQRDNLNERTQKHAAQSRIHSFVPHAVMQVYTRCAKLGTAFVTSYEGRATSVVRVARSMRASSCSQFTDVRREFRHFDHSSVKSSSPESWHRPHQRDGNTHEAHVLWCRTTYTAGGYRRDVTGRFLCQGGQAVDL